MLELENYFVKRLHMKHSRNSVTTCKKIYKQWRCLCETHVLGSIDAKVIPDPLQPKFVEWRTILSDHLSRLDYASGERHCVVRGPQSPKASPSGKSGNEFYPWLLIGTPHCWNDTLSTEKVSAPQYIPKAPTFSSLLIQLIGSIIILNHLSVVKWNHAKNDRSLPALLQSNYDLRALQQRQFRVRYWDGLAAAVCFEGIVISTSHWWTKAVCGIAYSARNNLK